MLYELKLSFRESEALRVFACVGIGIRKEYFRGRLFDDCAADTALQNITRALGREAHRCIQFAPGLRSVLGKGFKGRVRQQSPEFVHPAHQRTTIQEAADQMEEIQGQGASQDLLIEELGDIESQCRAQSQAIDKDILSVVEQMRVVPATAL